MPTGKRLGHPHDARHPPADARSMVRTTPDYRTKQRCFLGTGVVRCHHLKTTHPSYLASNLVLHGKRTPGPEAFTIDNEIPNGITGAELTPSAATLGIFQAYGKHPCHQTTSGLTLRR